VGVLPAWPTRQCQSGATQAVGVTGDVDGVNAVVGSDADPQQHLCASAHPSNSLLQRRPAP
jgi:hypothetical protein